MQNLLDRNLSVTDLKKITAPVDILDSDGMREQLKELGTDRAKADSIRSRLTKSISEKHDENPAYYDNFSKKIKETLEQYKNRVISEAEYLSKMTDIMNEYRSGKTEKVYPERIRNDVHSQAFFGIITTIIEEAKINTTEDILADLAADVTDLIKEYSKVDWSSNNDIHKKIQNAIDDLLYKYSDKYEWNLDFDTMDKLNDNIKTIALRRF